MEEYLSFIISQAGEIFTDIESPPPCDQQLQLPNQQPPQNHQQRLQNHQQPQNTNVVS